MGLEMTNIGAHIVSRQLSVSRVWARKKQTKSQLTGTMTFGAGQRIFIHKETASVGSGVCRAASNTRVCGAAHKVQLLLLLSLRLVW